MSTKPGEDSHPTRARFARILLGAIKIVASISFASLLAGCDKLEMGSWQVVGNAQVPGPFDPKKQKFRILPLAPGDGPEIKPGSLVHAKIHDLTYPICGRTNKQYPCNPAEEANHDVWFWVGREKPDLNLGSYDLRAAFIGIRAGARLTFMFTDRANVGLPKRVFLLNNAWDLKNNRYHTYDEEILSIDGNEEQRYDFEVLRVCEGRLLQRHATLTQRGLFGHVGGGPVFSFKREGSLEWLAMEAECASPKETIRFEKGPAFDARHGDLAGRWIDSYKLAVEKGHVN